MRGETMARYYPPNYNKREQSTQIARLRLRPDARQPEIQDQVVLSILVIERLRVLSGGEHKELA